LRALVHDHLGESGTAAPAAVDFTALALEPEAPGIASQATQLGGVRWALVAYEPGVLREEWCEAGHSGYVVAGEVVYEFADGRAPLRVGAGEGLALPDGVAHRGRSGAEGARLFLIDRAP
jgi:hypothetical protein